MQRGVALQPGYRGDQCQQQCDSQHWGQDCAYLCQCVVSNTKNCEPNTGTCICSDGFTGDTCELEVSIVSGLLAASFHRKVSKSNEQNLHPFFALPSEILQKLVYFVNSKASATWLHCFFFWSAAMDKYATEVDATVSMKACVLLMEVVTAQKDMKERNAKRLAHQISMGKTVLSAAIVTMEPLATR